MGMRFRKSIQIVPGVKLNLNKKSTSISVGTRGARKTFSTTGRTTTTVGIPGTGISYSTSGKRKSGSGAAAEEHYEIVEKPSFFDRWENNPKEVNILVYALLALFLGMFGVQKFYKGNTRSGMKSLVFFWTGVPLVIGVFEGLYCLIVYLVGIVKNRKSE